MAGLPPATAERIEKVCHQIYLDKVFVCVNVGIISFGIAAVEEFAGVSSAFGGAIPLSVGIHALSAVMYNLVSNTLGNGRFSTPGLALYEQQAGRGR